MYIHQKICVYIHISTRPCNEKLWNCPNFIELQFIIFFLQLGKIMKIAEIFSESSQNELPESVYCESPENFWLCYAVRVGLFSGAE